MTRARWAITDSLRPGLTREADSGDGEIDLSRWAVLTLRRFFAHGMTVFAAALAYRGLLALIPFALLLLALLGVFGLDGSFPRLTSALLRLRAVGPESGAATGVPLQGLISIGAVVGIWSLSMGARLLMRALNAAHEIPETRGAAVRVAFSVILLPGLALVTVLATAMLIVTTRLISWIAGWVGVGPLVAFLGNWLRVPLAFAMLAVAVSAVYRFGPSAPPSYRAVASGAAVAIVLWAMASFGFAFAVSTVVDYGTTYGGLGVAVALLVYLHISSVVLLLGAEVCATIDEHEIHFPTLSRRSISRLARYFPPRAAAPPVDRE